VKKTAATSESPAEVIYFNLELGVGFRKPADKTVKQLVKESPPPSCCFIVFRTIIMPIAKILAFSGSARRHSYNQRLVEIAASGARNSGAVVTVISLRDFPMPLFDEDLERDQGLPEATLRLKALFQEHAGLLIACPEYNSSITPLLKNTLDWVSRPAPGEPSLVSFRGKSAALLSGSPGALGGLRGLVHVRAILGNIGVVVLPDQVAVGTAHDAFDGAGSLVDPAIRSRVLTLGEQLAELVRQRSAAV
jgi:NAD(P)H-dependent FMN reductase